MYVFKTGRLPEISETPRKIGRVGASEKLNHNKTKKRNPLAFILLRPLNGLLLRPLNGLLSRWASFGDYFCKLKKWSSFRDEYYIYRN